MMEAPDLLTLSVNLLAGGGSLFLLRRGPTRRLRLLVFAVGVMSMAQVSATLYGMVSGQGAAAGLPQLLGGGLSLYALFLIYQEIRDRNLTDFRLRLAEHERQPSFGPIAPRFARPWPAGFSIIAAGAGRIEDLPDFHCEPAPGPAEKPTADLLALSLAIGKSIQPNRTASASPDDRQGSNVGWTL